MKQNSFALVPLTQGFFTFVELEDLPTVILHSWSAHLAAKGKVYARSKIDGRWVYMHRLLLCPNPGEVVDHRNGSGLDNRKHNLRACTQAENTRNRGKSFNVKTGFKGVYQNHSGQFQAKVKWNYKSVYIGSFADKYDAATAYNFAAAGLHGEFAVYNTVPQPWLEDPC